MDGDVKELIKQLREEAEAEALKQELVSRVNGQKKDVGSFMEEIIEHTALGFGSGVLTQMFFNIGTGTMPNDVTGALSGPLVMVFITLGFGLGFARGYKKMIGK